MESEHKSWIKAATLSSLFFGIKKDSLVDRAVKSFLPRAYAATQPSVTAALQSPAAQEAALEADHPVMEMRRQLVGKAYSMNAQLHPKASKFDDIDSEAKGMLMWG